MDIPLLVSNLPLVRSYEECKRKVSFGPRVYKPRRRISNWHERTRIKFVTTHAHCIIFIRAGQLCAI